MHVKAWSLTRLIIFLIINILLGDVHKSPAKHVVRKAPSLGGSPQNSPKKIMKSSFAKLGSQEKIKNGKGGFDMIFPFDETTTQLAYPVNNQVCTCACILLVQVFFFSLFSATKSRPNLA